MHKAIISKKVIFTSMLHTLFDRTNIIKNIFQIFGCKPTNFFVLKKPSELPFGIAARVGFNVFDSLR